MRNFFFCLTLSIALPAMALPSRVFVSSAGVDSGACPIATPCRSFGYAITQVATGGEVIALDTAGYGTFTIGQPVIVFAAPGATAFIGVTSGTGITITAAAADQVVLRNLALSGTGGTIGVDFQTGGSLSVENCIVNGFSNIGIQMARSGDPNNPKLTVDGSTIRNNNNGIYSTNFSTSSPITVTISRSSISENGWGLNASDNTHGAATDSVFSGNNQIGVQSWTAHDSAGPDITLERCTISQNTTGVSAGFQNQVGGPSHGIIRIAHNQVFGNGLGVNEWADGKIMTLVSNNIVTNTIEGNITDGTFTGSYTAK